MNITIEIYFHVAYSVWSIFLRIGHKNILLVLIACATVFCKRKIGFVQENGQKKELFNAREGPGNWKRN